VHSAYHRATDWPDGLDPLNGTQHRSAWSRPTLCLLLIAQALTLAIMVGFRSRVSVMASGEPLLTFTRQQLHLNYIELKLNYCKLNSH